MGRGCVLFFLTAKENVIQGAVKKGFVLLDTKDWLRETEPGLSEEDLAAAAHGIEVTHGLRVYKKDDFSFGNAHKVESIQGASRLNVVDVLTGN